MTRIKICGIKDKALAIATIEAGANLIGQVFAPSHRQINPNQSREIVAAIKECSDNVEVVGIFVNLPAPEVNRIASFCNLDWVQLSGDESWEYCRQISKPLIKAVRIKRGQRPQQIHAKLAAGAKLLAGQRCIYLLDSQVKDRYGGTGTTFDWSLARQAAAQFPVIIAGGLAPENVSQAIEVAAPWGVDVSSGVEVDGAKDIARIRAFIEAVRRVDDSKG